MYDAFAQVKYASRIICSETSKRKFHLWYFHINGGNPVVIGLVKTKTYRAVKEKANKWTSSISFFSHLFAPKYFYRHSTMLQNTVSYSMCIRPRYSYLKCVLQF